MASYRPITEEIEAPTTSGNATNVSNADIVRAVNTSGSSVLLLTIVDENGGAIGSMSLVPSEVVFIKKRESDRIYGDSADIRLTRTTYPVV